MKKFYRKANGNDFDEVARYWSEMLPIDVLELLNNGEYQKGIQEYRNKTGMPMRNCKDIVDGYMNYRKASNDFIFHNQQIYVEY